MSNKVEVDFNGWIQKGFEIWKSNLLTLIVATLLYMVIGGLSFGILIGPMVAGLMLIVLALHDGTQPKPQIGDVFKGFSLFLPTFLLVLMMFGVSLVLALVAFIPCIGIIIQMAGSILVGQIFVFSLFHIADQKLPVIDSIKAGIAVLKLNFWPLLGFQFLAGIIGMSGAIACGVGIFVTMPLAWCMMAVAYRAMTGTGPKPSAAEPTAQPLLPQA